MFKYFRVFEIKKFIFFILLLNTICVVDAEEPIQIKISNIKAIIFDCDGVLVDTEYLKFLAWNKTLKNYKMSFDLNEYKPLVGYSSKYILKNILIKNKDKSLNSREILLKKDKIYRSLQLNKVRPISSAIDLVLDLAKNKQSFNIKLALASSGTKEEILHNLKIIGLENIFDVIVSGNDDLNDIADEETNKPKPYIYLKTAKLLNVDAKNCLVFEDSYAGVVAAVSAGMTVIAVPNNFTKDQNFFKAVFILDTLEKFKTNYITGN